MEGGPGTDLRERSQGVGRSSGLMKDCRNLGMESWRFAGGTTGFRSAGGFLMTEHTHKRHTCDNDIFLRLHFMSLRKETTRQIKMALAMSLIYNDFQKNTEYQLKNSI